MISRIADRVRVALALLGPLGAGSRVLLLRLVERFGWKTVGAGALFLVYAAARYRTWIVWGIVIWYAAAWMHAPKDDVEDAPEEPEDQQKSTPQEVYVATLEWIRGQIADSNGIHISALLANAHAHGLHTDLDVPAFRAVLEQWGFPIRQQLKVDGRNRPGIHRDDLPTGPLPDSSPEEGAPPGSPAEYPI